MESGLSCSDQFSEHEGFRGVGGSIQISSDADEVLYGFPNGP